MPEDRPYVRAWRFSADFDGQSGRTAESRRLRPTGYCKNQLCLTRNSQRTAPFRPHVRSPTTHILPNANSGRRRTQMGIAQYDPTALGRPAWNAGRNVRVKKPLKQRQIWAIRFFLDREKRMRDRALFDLAIDSKLQGCDLVKIKIGTLATGTDIRTRAMVIQQKTGRPVQFEITANVRASLLGWLERRGGRYCQLNLFFGVEVVAHGYDARSRFSPPERLSLSTISHRQCSMGLSSLCVEHG